MHKNYTGDFNGSFMHKEQQHFANSGGGGNSHYQDQTLKSLAHHINQSETMTLTGYSQSNGVSRKNNSNH